MPSQKTAEKAAVKNDLIEITAVCKFAVDYTPEELKKMQGEDKEKRSHVGMTKIIEVGESTSVTRAIAKKMTDAGAAKVKL